MSETDLTLLPEVHHPSVVHYFGDEGSFTYLAARDFYPGSDSDKSLPSPRFGFEGHAIIKKMAGCLRDDPNAVGVIPIQNYNTSLVKDSANALFTGELEVMGEHLREIRLALMGVAKNIDQIREVRSHHQALDQAYDFLASIGAEPKDVPSTSHAVKEVAEMGRRDIAAIGPAHLADKFGLRILHKDVADEPNNWTDFIVVRAFDRNRAASIWNPNIAPSSRDGRLLKVTALATNLGKSAADACLGLFTDHKIPYLAPENRAVPGEGIKDRRASTRRVHLVEMTVDHKGLWALARDERILDKLNMPHSGGKIPKNAMMILQTLGIFPATFTIENQD